MANSLSTNPIVLDTFTSDVIVFNNFGVITLIVLRADNVGDDAVFTDNNGVQAIHIAHNNSNGMTVWSPKSPVFFVNGLKFDSGLSSGLGAGFGESDLLFIYLF